MGSIWQHKKSSFRQQSAFTLIELLAVIAIIGILASIIAVQLRDSQTDARDAVRIADYQRFVLGLIIFHNKYGVYPCGDRQASSQMTRDDSISFDTFLNGKREGHSAPANCIGLPDTGLYTDGLTATRDLKDSINNNAYHYYYLVSEYRQSYVLVAHLESGDEIAKNDGGFCDNYYEVGPGAGVLNPGNVFSGTQCN